MTARAPRSSNGRALDSSSHANDQTKIPPATNTPTRTKNPPASNTSPTTKMYTFGCNGFVNDGTMHVYVQPHAPEDGMARANAVGSTEEDQPGGYLSSSTDPESNIRWSVEHSEFMELYTSMSDRSMWTLVSGRHVETIIRDAVDRIAENEFKQSLLRWFILDPCDTSMKEFFHQAELDEIKSAFPPLPAANEVLHNIIQPFFKAKTTDDLKTLLFASGRPVLPESADDQPIAFWIDMVLRTVYNLFSSPNNLLSMSQNEGWYIGRVWTNVIDEAFTHVQSIVFDRGESVCRASSILLNHDRKCTGGMENRQKSGPKLDGIIRTTSSDYLELGATEVAKSYHGLGATKMILDGRKLRSVLRDMLMRLHDTVDDEDVAKLQTVGIINAGRKFQLVRCWARKRHGVVLCMAEPMREFPGGMGKMSDLWLLLKVVDQAKRIVEDVRKIVETSSLMRTAEEMSKAFMS